MIEGVTDPAVDGPDWAIESAGMTDEQDGDGDFAYSAEELSSARRRLGLTVTELSKRVGMNGRRSITRFEAEGIPASSRYLDAVERTLGLGSYAHQTPVVADPTTLPDGALWALSAACHAELQRRFWETRPSGTFGPPLRVGGKKGAYPTHLDEEGSSHDRGESYR